MPDLNAVFTELRSIMAPYAAELDPKKDDVIELYVDTKYIQKNKKPLFRELASLTKAAFVSYKEQGFV
jgi:hypothetical protein